MPETSSPEPQETAAQPARPVFENPGYCACCQSQTVFVAHDEWLRDFYICRNCGSIPRQRHLQTVLEETIPGWKDLVVHESSPSNGLLSRVCTNYSSSHYYPDVPRGEYRDGVRSEDVEALTFPDESIDVFITQDVLEHVFHPDRAVREIHRVLRPGGAHVFTTPKYPWLSESRARARVSAHGVVEHLFPEEYHGNPIGDNKALVTWDYGDDFELLLSEWVGAGVQTHRRRDRSLGIDAEFNEVFVIRKPVAGAGTAGSALGQALSHGSRAAVDLARVAARRVRPVVGRVKRGVLGAAGVRRAAG
ncbi:class I SAM-dependent methyltransferase [Blastococcus deserti]|uniref:Class I SAM-dependent methyltransferase n=1 Tax=Blastococcus deserti TaxID=2259033 RepID=A0ABW4X6N1_9ACTN